MSTGVVRAIGLACALLAIGAPLQAPQGAIGAVVDGDVVTLRQQLPSGAWWEIDLAPLPAPGGMPLRQLTASRVESRWGRTLEPILTVQPSAYEYAVCVDGVWYGNIHGYEREVDLAVEEEPDRVVVTRTSRLGQPDSSDLAVSVVRYEMTSEGLRVQSTIRWLQAAEVDRAYVGMLPANEALSRGRVGSTGVRLDRGHGAAAGGVRIATTEASVWGGGVTASVTLDRAMPVWIEDRAGDALNKVYPTLIDERTAVPAGDVWRSDVLYRVSWDG